MKPFLVVDFEFARYTWNYFYLFIGIIGFPVSGEVYKEFTFFLIGALFSGKREMKASEARVCYASGIAVITKEERATLLPEVDEA